MPLHVSSTVVLIIRRPKLYYTASSIVTPVGGCPEHMCTGQPPTGSVNSTGYPLHSPVSPSLPLPCVTVCHYISTGVYEIRKDVAWTKGWIFIYIWVSLLKNFTQIFWLLCDSWYPSPVCCFLDSLYFCSYQTMKCWLSLLGDGRAGFSRWYFVPNKSRPGMCVHFWELSCAYVWRINGSIMY